MARSLLMVLSAFPLSLFLLGSPLLSSFLLSATALADIPDEGASPETVEEHHLLTSVQTTPDGVIAYGERGGRHCTAPDWRVGDRVVLGRHDRVRGRTNWARAMDHYVGMEARIENFGGQDRSGCQTVRVDIDGGRYAWRARSLQAARNDQNQQGEFEEELEQEEQESASEDEHIREETRQTQRGTVRTFSRRHRSSAQRSLYRYRRVRFQRW